MGAGQRGHWAGDAVEDGAAFGALAGLEALPSSFDQFGSGGVGVGEDVGVAADELGANAFGDVVEGEAAVLLGEFGVEDDLHEQVAEFFAELLGGAVGQGVEDFVGFFEQVRSERLVGLGQVPWATVVGIAEAVDGGAEALRILTGFVLGEFRDQETLGAGKDCRRQICDGGFDAVAVVEADADGVVGRVVAEDCGRIVGAGEVDDDCALGGCVGGGVEDCDDRRV